MSKLNYYELMEEIATELAHEVKNPLSLIIANIGLLELYDTAHCHEQNYAMIRREVERINNLLVNFIKFAQPNEVNEKNFVSFSFNELLNELVLLHKEIYQHIEFSFICENSDVTLWGDMGKIRQVVSNILKNAIESVEDHLTKKDVEHEHLSEKEATNTKAMIKIDLSLHKEHIILSILDNGKGISEQEKEKVFKPFYTTKPGGSGLGLSLCKSIIAEHNGILEIAERPEEGCLVLITLPKASQETCHPQAAS